MSKEELGAAEERAFRKLVKSAKLPGFRPGKVPRKVFEQAYGAESITSQAMEDVVPAVYAKAVREHDLDPIDRPRMELLPEEDGKPTRVKAVVDVRPTIELGDYKGIHIERPAVAVTDEDVERSLEALARDRATLIPAERPAQLGDVVTVDYEGTIDGVAFEGGSAKKQVTDLVEDRFIPGFASGIAGMKTGESKNVEAKFPDAYAKSDLAGKTAIFAVTLHEVKELELPSIDDAFAKEASQSESLEALKDDIRKRLEAVAQGKAKRELGHALVGKLSDAHDFPLPDILVEREIDSMISDAGGFAQRMGMSFEAYLKAIEKTEADLRSEYFEDAKGRVKGTLLLEAIAKAEKISATPADVSAELQGLAQQYGQPVERIRQALGSNILSVIDGIVRTKTVEFLIENASVKEATPPPSS
ncbi:MAG: trigger factor [Candidatus Eremiobacteraeota bacterium]|nr:trigger factor [Candidatus Eremiobacteraeota bacterium]